MLLETRHFGELEIDCGNIIRFENGIPGFDDVKEFALIDSQDEKSPFKWLQCIDVPELAFAVINPFCIKKDYDFEMKDEVVNELEIKNETDVQVFSIIVVPEDATKMTMNLRAPLIINTRTGKGAQIILDTDKYSVRHYILDEIRRQEVAENACADKEKGSVDHNK